MNDKSKPSQYPSAARQQKVIVPDPAPDELGHEGFESNIKQNTTNQGQRKDRGD
jgi:hypothetical protein